MLLPACFAAENETIIQPTAPQTTSIEKLVSSMDAMKDRIAALEASNNELRVQLDSKLTTQYWGYLLFFIVYMIFIFSVRGILGEIWTWLMYSRKKRKVEKFQERIAKELKETTIILQAINASLSEIKLDVAEVEKKKLPEPEHKKKRSFWDKIFRRGKDAK